MSADLDDRLRAALRSAPEPEGLAERLREAVLGSLDQAPRRRVRFLGRGLRWALGAAAACGVAAILALLLIATPSDPPATPSDTTGVEYVLRTIPSRDGLSPEAAATRLAEVLGARARARGIAGLSIAADGDRVRLFVPRTHDTDWADSFLYGLDLAVYDNRASVLAVGRRLETVARAAERVARPGVALRYYVAVSRKGRGAPSYLEGPFGSAQEATARSSELRAELGPPTRVATIGAGIALAQNYSPPQVASAAHPVFAALEDPVVEPGDIETVRASGTSLSVLVAPGARAEVAARLDALAAVDGGTLTLAAGATAFPATRFRRYDERTGALLFATSRPQGAYDAAQFAGGGVDGLVAIDQARAVGPPPARRGRRVAAIPSRLEGLPAGDRVRPQAGSVLRVLRTGYEGRRWSVYTWIGSDGKEVVGSVTVPGVGGTASTCPIQPELPAIQPCLSSGTPSHTSKVVLGRVGDEANSLRVDYADGSSAAATVQNGWFLLFLPRDRRRPSAIVVADRSGAELGRLDARTPGQEFIFG